MVVVWLPVTAERTAALGWWRNWFCKRANVCAMASRSSSVSLGREANRAFRSRLANLIGVIAQLLEEQASIAVVV